MQRWHTLAAHYNHKYGCRVQKIPLDAGACCPNRDGTAFERWLHILQCQRLWLLAAQNGAAHCRSSGMPCVPCTCGTTPIRALLPYLQSFSNTLGHRNACGTTAPYRAQLASVLWRGPWGTRPDCLDAPKLDTLAALDCDLWLELGLQTAHDPTLSRINRGHTAAHAEKAVRMAAERGIAVCAHLMAGLPGEDEAPFFAKHRLGAHPAHQGAQAAQRICAQRVLPSPDSPQVSITLSGATNMWTMLCAALPRIPSHIVLHRLQSDPAPRELVAPTWATDKRRRFASDFRARGIYGRRILRLTPEVCPAVFLGAGCVKEDFTREGRVPKAYTPLVKYSFLASAQEFSPDTIVPWVFY